MARKKLELAGTKEAAEILGVERPRIGRLIKRGVMPETAADVAATPLWFVSDIEAMRSSIEAGRRKPRERTCACGCGQDPGVYDKTRASRGQVKGEPREYAKGHEKRGVAAMNGGANG